MVAARKENILAMTSEFDIAAPGFDFENNASRDRHFLIVFAATNPEEQKIYFLTK